MSSMSVQQFFLHLQAQLDKPGYTVSIECGRFRIHCITGRSFCPITFVAYALHRCYYGVDRWCEAAQCLGLEPGDAASIAYSADHSS